MATDMRITTSGKVRNYVRFALRELRPAEDRHARKASAVRLRAVGAAINKAVTVAEIVKRRLNGIHQVTTAELLADDASSPALSILLSTAPPPTSSPGYQPPADGTG